MQFSYIMCASVSVKKKLLGSERMPQQADRRHGNDREGEKIGREQCRGMNRWMSLQEEDYPAGVFIRAQDESRAVRWRLPARDRNQDRK